MAVCCYICASWESELVQMTSVGDNIEELLRSFSVILFSKNEPTVKEELKKGSVCISCVLFLQEVLRKLHAMEQATKAAQRIRRSLEQKLINAQSSVFIPASESFIAPMPNVALKSFLENTDHFKFRDKIIKKLQEDFNRLVESSSGNVGTSNEDSDATNFTNRTIKTEPIEIDSNGVDENIASPTDTATTYEANSAPTTSTSGSSTTVSPAETPEERTPSGPNQILFFSSLDASRIVESDSTSFSPTTSELPATSPTHVPPISAFSFPPGFSNKVFKPPSSRRSTKLSSVKKPPTSFQLGVTIENITNGLKRIQAKSIERPKPGKRIATRAKTNECMTRSKTSSPRRVREKFQKKFVKSSSHKSSNHKSSSNYNPREKCLYCSEFVGSVQSHSHEKHPEVPFWRSHINEDNSHISNPLNSINLYDNSELVACPIHGCGNRANGKYQALKHLKGSHGYSSVVPCLSCFQFFRTVTLLNAHMKRVNHPVKKFECGSCKMQFRSHDENVKHYRSAHSSSDQEM